MERPEDRGPELPRRGVLSALGGIGVSSTLASVVAGPNEGNGVSLLGARDAGAGGWRADGAIDLTRVERRIGAGGVTAGGRALEVSVEGDPAPRIHRPTEGIDPVARPYLLADVAPGTVSGTDSPVAFRFRLDRDGEPVAASPPVTVRQATPGQLFWDASDVPRRERAAATRLSLTWRPADGARTDRSAVDDYHGTVTVDDVRATGSVDPVGRARVESALRDLESAHGSYVETTVLSRSDAHEAGRVHFAGGTAEPYRFEVLSGARYRLTLAGTEARFGEGWG